MTIEPAKFKINQSVWYNEGEVEYYCRIWGVEDGRNLPKYKGGWDGWMYWICIYGYDGKTSDRIVREDQLEDVISERTGRG